jgi:hypothetical protein
VKCKVPLESWSEAMVRSLLYLSVFGLLLLNMVFPVQISGQVYDSEKLRTYDQYKEAPLAAMMPLRNEHAVLTRKRTASVFYECLNGTRKIKWLRKPADRPEDFYQETHEEFKHTNDIAKKDGVYNDTDMKMIGVVGDDSLGAKTYPDHSNAATIILSNLLWASALMVST